VAVERIPGTDAALSFADVLDRVLDKGIVIDYRANIGLVGVALMRVEAIVVMTSFDWLSSPAHASAAPMRAAEEYLRSLNRVGG
jgi:hypothetical protein